MPMNGIIIVLGFASLLHGVRCQSDNYIISALGFQGDKLTDLESIVKTLQTQFKGLQTEVTQLKDENSQLKKEIEYAVRRCNMSACCSQCHNDLTTSTPYQNSSTLPRMTTLTSTLMLNATNQPFTSQSVNTSAAVLTTSSSNFTTTALKPVTSHVATYLGNQTSTPMSSNMTTRFTTTQYTNYTMTTTHSSTLSSNLTTTKQTQKPQMTSGSTLPTTTTSGVTVYADCEDAVKNGKMGGEIVNIKLDSTGHNVQVFCDEDGWLVIQRRQDGSQSFNQTWNTYKQGFGDLKRNFWLGCSEERPIRSTESNAIYIYEIKNIEHKFGNENIYKLTSNRDYILHIDFEDWAQNKRYAEYEHFRLDSEQYKYTLFAGSYTGNAGDSFHYRSSYMLTHFQMPFSTPDMDNDKSPDNCAKRLSSGWWFNNCYSSDLNGPYLSMPYGHRMLGEMTGQPTLEGTGIEWYPYRKRQYSFKKVSMKIKPMNSAGLIG